MKKTGFYIVLFAVLIATVEFIFSLLFFVKDSHDNTKTSTIDYPYLYYLQKDEGYNNLFGFRTNSALKKSEDVLRVILTGGSVARSFNAPDTNTIAHYLEKKLNSKSKKYEVNSFNQSNSKIAAKRDGFDNEYYSDLNTMPF